MHVRRLIQLSVGVGVLMLWLGDARPAEAQFGCFTGLRGCFNRAAVNPADFLDMWLKGLDCELDFIDCTRRAILGR